MTRRYMYDGWNQVALVEGETQTVRTCANTGDGSLVYVEIDDEGIKKGKNMAEKTSVSQVKKFMIPFNPEWLRRERKCIVRRLMPIECERLMLYPDGHTKLSEDTADSSMYRQCGNGWAVNESTFIFMRQHIVDAMVEGFVKKFKFGTISSGIGCHELSVADLGDESVFSSEIDPACCKLWDVRFPDTPNLGDMTRVTYDAEKGCICNPKYEGYQDPDPKVLGFKPVDKEYREIPFKYGELDVLSGGTPCFVAGSMVLTDRGYLPIEQIKVGDLVVTHRGNLKRVEKVGKKFSNDIYRVKAVSRAEVLVTGNHPFLSMRMGRDYVRTSPTYGRTIQKGPVTWQPVEGLTHDHYLAIPSFDGTLPMPELPVVYKATKEQITELIGWYLGDGYVRRFKGKNKKAVIFCLNHDKARKFQDRFGGALSYTESVEGSAIRITMYCTAFAEFLIREFGQKATGKRVPAWVVCGSADVKERIWAGYMATDGTITGRTERACSVSKALVHGFSDAMPNASFFTIKHRVATEYIQGRKVNTNPAYEIQLTRGATRNFHEVGGFKFVKARTVEKVGRGDFVYNIQVADDHSYICNGYCVHNCTDYSVAGKRKGGAEGSNTRSALSYQMARIGKETGARWIVYENVPGIFSSHGGKDFLWFCHRLCEAGYTLAWRTFDAQYVTTYKHPRATPQRRRRVWLVGYRGTDWRIPAQVVFEKAKDLGTEPPMRLTGKGFLTLNPDFDPEKSVAKKTGKNRKKACIEMELLGGDLFAMAEPKAEEPERRKVSRIMELSEFPDGADIREVGDVSLYQFGQKVGTVESVGNLFKEEGEASVDGMNEFACQNIGNAGIMSQGKVMTLTCAEWNAGIQLSPEQYDLYLQYEANGEWLKAEGLLPEAYDGTVCGIQDILERNAPVEYWLSWKACWGVVRRAIERGKELPRPLLVALVMRIIAEAPRVKWAALNAPDTENGRKERRNALSCFESVCHAIGKLEYEKVEALPPPKGAAEEDGDDGEDGGMETGMLDDEDGEGYSPGAETCGSLCAADGKGKNGQDAGSGKILDLHLKKNGTGDGEVSAEEVRIYENHAQDCRVQGLIEVAPTCGASNANSMGISGNNPLVTYSKVGHARNGKGEGEHWVEAEVAQTRNVFDGGGDIRSQEVVCEGVSTNSNGEEVMPTISACEYKMGQKQKDTSGGYILDRTTGDGDDGEEGVPCA